MRLKRYFARSLVLVPIGGYTALWFVHVHLHSKLPFGLGSTVGALILFGFGSAVLIIGGGCALFFTIRWIAENWDA